MVNIQFFVLKFDGIYVILIIICFLAILFFLNNFFGERNVILRKLKKIKTKDPLLIKNQEYTKLKGKAIPLKETLLSPIGNRKCVYYKIKIQKKTRGKNRYWKTIIKEEKSEDFVIEVSDKKIIVQANIPENLKRVYLIEDVQYSSGTWNDASPNLEKYLNSKGEKSTGMFGFNKKLRYKEAAIEVDEEIMILGNAIWKKTDQQWDRYSSDTLFLYGDKQQKLIITDDPEAFKSTK